MTVGVGVAVCAALVWVGTARLVRRLGVLPVREIELVGVKYLAPEAVIAALHLAPGASIFEDARVLADRVRGLNGVADASVRWRLPGTLVVRVREVEPAALVPETPGGRLVPVDAKGRSLPFDPERTGLDLPVAATRDPGAVSVLALVQSVDPALFQSITGARTLAGGDVSLECGSHRVLVRRDAAPEDIRAVVLVAQDLASRGRGYAELDARFGGQVVVRARAKSWAEEGGV